MPDKLEIIDKKIGAWRQGDIAFPEGFLFYYIADLSCALTQPSLSYARKFGAEKSRLAAVPLSSSGIVMLSQTCDVVRSCKERPLVEVGPLAPAEEILTSLRRRKPDSAPNSLDELINEIGAGMRPAYAVLPAASKKRLVVDLDRSMTVEKTVVANWTRVDGWALDNDGRKFAQALARKRVRVAFPDDFNMAMRKLFSRIKKKHDKNSFEGQFLKELREIRVQAFPSWSADEVELTFFFIVISHDSEKQMERDRQIGDWLSMIDQGGRFNVRDGNNQLLREMTADTYLSSDPLDFDHLSG